MISGLCPRCRPAALRFLDPMQNMARKLDEIRKAPDNVAELDRLVAEGEKLARSFDAILCAECRKLGPPLPPWLG